MKARLSDETWVPLKWIYTIVGSCAVTIVTVISAVWYLGALVAREDVANAALVEHDKRLTSLEERQQKEMQLWQSVDGRLSHIEGYLSARRKDH